MGGSHKRKNLAVYGAGDAGAQILQSLRTSVDYRVCMIIDDNPKVQGKEILVFASSILRKRRVSLVILILIRFCWPYPAWGLQPAKKIFRASINTLEVKTFRLLPA